MSRWLVGSSSRYMLGRNSFILRKTSRARSPWLRMAIGSGVLAKGKPAPASWRIASRLGDAGRFQHVVEDRHVDRQVAHGLVEIDQPAGRVEAHRREAVVVLQLRDRRPAASADKQRRLAGAVDAQQRDAVAGGDGQSVDGDQLAVAARRHDVEAGDAQRHLGVDVAVGQLQPPLARDIGLGAILLDAGDARLDGALALVEVGVLDRPDLVARRGLLQAADLLVLELRARRRRRVAAQQLLARLARSAS